MRCAIDAATQCELSATVGVRFDVLSIDADRRRSEEAKPRRCLGVRHADELDRRLQTELGDERSYERVRLLIVRTAVEVEDLDHRLSRYVLAPIRSGMASLIVHQPVISRLRLP
jgi:hypothetical protein